MSNYGSLSDGIVSVQDNPVIGDWNAVNPTPTPVTFPEGPSPIAANEVFSLGVPSAQESDYGLSGNGGNMWENGLLPNAPSEVGGAPNENVSPLLEGVKLSFRVSGHRFLGISFTRCVTVSIASGDLSADGQRAYQSVSDATIWPGRLR